MKQLRFVVLLVVLLVALFPVELSRTPQGTLALAEIPARITRLQDGDLEVVEVLEIRAAKAADTTFVRRVNFYQSGVLKAYTKLTIKARWNIYQQVMIVSANRSHWVDAGSGWYWTWQGSSLGSSGYTSGCITRWSADFLQTGPIYYDVYIGGMVCGIPIDVIQWEVITTPGP